MILNKFSLSAISKHFLLIMLFSAIGYLPAVASTQSDAIAKKLLRAQYCIDAYASKVFVDGAPGPQATPIAIVQCSELIADYADNMVEEMEVVSSKQFSEAERSKILARLIFDLFDKQNSFMIGKPSE